MNIGLWAEIRRLTEIEKLSGRAISRRLRCSRYLVAAALKLDRPPARRATRRASLLDLHRPKIDALLARYPDLSAVRVHEEIARGLDGYTGSVITVRRYLRKVRPARPCLPRSPLRTGPGDAGRLGRMRPRANWQHDAQSFGIRGRALL